MKALRKTKRIFIFNVLAGKVKEEMSVFFAEIPGNPVIGDVMKGHIVNLRSQAKER